MEQATSTQTLRRAQGQTPQAPPRTALARSNNRSGRNTKQNRDGEYQEVARRSCDNRPRRRPVTVPTHQRLDALELRRKFRAITCRRQQRCEHRVKLPFGRVRRRVEPQTQVTQAVFLRLRGCSRDSSVVCSSLAVRCQDDRPPARTLLPRQKTTSIGESDPPGLGATRFCRHRTSACTSAALPRSGASA